MGNLCLNDGADAAELAVLAELAELEPRDLGTQELGNREQCTVDSEQLKPEP